jgi:predicted PurR-regulated permease PerM
MSKQIETDFRTFVKFWLVPLIFAGILFFLYSAKTGLIIVGISIFLALALKPLVNIVNSFFTKHFGTEKKHQTLSAALAYLIVVVVIGGILAIVGPVVVNETANFVQNFPSTFEKTFGGWDGINDFGKVFGIDDLHTKIANTVSELSTSLLSTLGNSLVSGVSGIADMAMKIMLTLILTLLFMLEGPALMSSLWHNLETGEENKKPVLVARRIVSKMANVISIYVSRQAIVAVIDGCASGLIVLLISLFTDVPTSIALPMGMITMLFYLIPMFGQFIGGTLVTAILLFNSLPAGLIFAIVYIIYAQIENNVIAPKIQGNALNLPAVIILAAIVIGMYMFGLIGAIVAVPIAGCIRVLVDEYPNIKAARK